MNIIEWPPSNPEDETFIKPNKSFCITAKFAVMSAPPKTGCVHSQQGFPLFDRCERAWSSSELIFA
jgi:hypothetical protein